MYAVASNVSNYSHSRVTLDRYYNFNKVKMFTVKMFEHKYQICNLQLMLFLH